MRILTRYILWEFLKVFLVTLAGTTLLMIVVGVAMEAKQQGIGLVQTLRLLPYILPDALRFAVPGTTLFAACNVYGRVSQSNEIVAAKSLGISPMVFLWPVIILGAGLSLVSVWLNDVAVSWGRAGVQRVVVESVEQIAYGMLRAQRSYSTDSMSMNVKTVEGRTLVKPMLTLKGGKDTPPVTITADTAEMHSDPVRGEFIMRFYNATMDMGAKGRVTWPDVYEHVVNLSDFSRKGDQSDKPSNQALTDIPGKIRAELAQIEQLKQQYAATAAFEIMTGDMDALIDKDWLQRERELAAAWETVHRLRTEPHRRYANGASCLCFILVGAPLAIYRRRGEFMTNFFVCFMPILLVYYPLLITGVDRAKAGAWPPYSVWLGNIILAFGGWLLLRKVVRY
jgi:lipopolysaccharide export system permease protein